MSQTLIVDSWKAWSIYFESDTFLKPERIYWSEDQKQEARSYHREHYVLDELDSSFKTLKDGSVEYTEA